MNLLFYRLIKRSTAIALGMLAGTSAFLVVSTPLLAQKKTFPDVASNYWAQPFIQRLAEQNIISGYPDGTFRPEQPLERDEFAAIIRDAFNQNKVRQIASGSVFKDISADYWAASAIEEAYEAGFMNGFPGGYFRPREEISRVQAIVTLVNTLNLSPKPATPSVEQTTTQAQAIKKPKIIPLGFLALMQPAVMSPSAQREKSTSRRPPSFVVSNYYQDADKIPQYAVDEVATASRANIVVNYPNPKVLNPNQPLTRGAAAAVIYQTLVHQGKVPSIPVNVKAFNYIVYPPVE
jgi:S-layer homology domain